VQSNLVIAVLGFTVLVAALGDGLARFRLVRREASVPADAGGKHGSQLDDAGERAEVNV
jgi:hypothetical protein